MKAKLRLLCMFFLLAMLAIAQRTMCVRADVIVGCRLSGSS